MGREKKVARRGAREWQKIIEEHSRSRLGIKSYCQKMGISTASFYAWRQGLRERTSPRLKDFIKVIPAEKEIRASLRIKTPNGYWVEVAEGTERTFLKDVISALGER